MKSPERHLLPALPGKGNHFFATLTGFFFCACSTLSGQVFIETFETGGAGWTISGIGNAWEIGTPMYAYGPSSAYEQTNCAGTNLTGYYPNNANTRLVSPTIPLPTLNGNEKIKLGFYQWFNTTKPTTGILTRQTKPPIWGVRHRRTANLTTIPRPP
ncbi:MAG: hypothetical protein IPM98_06270 [Lewinellaceae bacterium]|nr:hypothetical protein [Lewinellaceae bacterium]